MNNEMNGQFEEKLGEILNDEVTKQNEENLIKKSRKTLNIIEWISLGFYLPMLAFYLFNALENSKKYGATAIKTMIQVFIFYLILEYIKKGHKNIAFLPLLGSLLSFIYVCKIFELAKYNDAIIFIGIYALCFAVWGSLSMAYVLFDADINSYCDYMKNK